jgi:2-succinyl-6-hydroxy-2,4-cyclohexadiene-1-carboxylate synthase
VDQLTPTPTRTVLHADRHGHGPRLVLVHGFTQTRRCWGPLEADLATDHQLVLVDAPGHGRSAGVTADVASGGRLIADAGGPATYLGYSMGGRFVLHTALERPDQVRGLVLVGATAGLDDPGERAARVADDEARAARLEAIGVEAFVDEWLRLPIFAGLPPESACRAERLQNTVAGLASSLRHAGTGTQLPSWDRLGELAMPVLVVAGADDAKFVALGRRMAGAIGSNATFETVEGAGHTAHLEQPERFLAIVRPWLATHDL